MTLPACPKIDCHIHAIDPVRFPYADDTPYRPSGQEIAPAAQLLRVFDAFDVRHALIVATNTSYGSDSRILLDTLEQGGGRFKGVAVVDNDVDIRELERLNAAGVIGVAYNVPFHGADYYRRTAGLLDKLESLGLFLQIQVENDQLLALLPLIEASRVRLVIDHCGRPQVTQGVAGKAFQTLLALGRERDAHVKLSGYYKFSQRAYPYEDAWPFIAALVEAFTLDRCVWGSDYPFLRAPERLDYGPLLTVLSRLFPDPDDQHRLLWRTPARLLGFSSDADQSR
ncbi:amidohydrolase [Bradyrhizobium liaoningense]|uniref:amidohydrolase family protein n=1 Tax=Bradyrhizobium liaoningense TaxID=43992 RepID=UPI001BAC6377|nr:amidohydrolase family protein [Bradyrhizobium liaoningense]MBR0716867.1 amidohydrolase family protein [Bradyrhizobium liaoningense]